MTRKATSRAILAHFTTPRLSIAQRFAAGKALREQFPREAHSWLPPAPYDRDPIAVLKAQATTRLKQLVPVRHARMQESPFAFLRGAAAIMAGDLVATPTPASWFRPVATCMSPTSASMRAPSAT